MVMYNSTYLDSTYTFYRNWFPATHSTLWQKLWILKTKLNDVNTSSSDSSVTSLILQSGSTQQVGAQSATGEPLVSAVTSQ